MNDPGSEQSQHVLTNSAVWVHPRDFEVWQWLGGGMLACGRVADGEIGTRATQPANRKITSKMITIVENHCHCIRRTSSAVHGINDLHIVGVNNEAIAAQPLRKGQTISGRQGFRRQDICAPVYLSIPLAMKIPLSSLRTARQCP